MFSVYIVEDHPAMRRAYRDLINGEAQLEVCGMADSAAAALQEVPQHAPDLVIIDISLKDSDGIQLVRELTKLVPDIATLIISGHESTIYAKAALEAGARGYIMKHDTRRITSAIYSALNNLKQEPIQSVSH